MPHLFEILTFLPICHADYISTARHVESMADDRTMKVESAVRLSNPSITHPLAGW